LIALFFACAKKPLLAPASTEPDEVFKKARAYYEVKNYAKAIDAFQKFIFSFPGSFYAGDAQFYLAESYFSKKNYSQAMIEYDFLVRNFTSTHREEAEYKYALCQYLTAPPYYKDQTQTMRAQELLTEFIADHPQSQFLPDARKTLARVRDRLAQKEYETARLYLRYDELTAALVYINYLEQTYPDADHTAQVKFLLARYYEGKQETAKAVELYQELVKTESSVKVQAEERLSKLKQ
jgi:outer membrane protein assembly factor BamD